MGERKVLNKYIPADFDPSLVPRGKKLSSKDGTVPVRMMLPFSIQCSTCHTFLYRGRKFNSKKEAMGGPDGKYLGITRWRFYIKCTHCSRPLSFLTDPKNADYEMESGGTRNYEIQKDKAATEEDAAAQAEEEEKQDPMKALENRVLESQSEQADLDNLEEIRAMNARHVKLLAGAGKTFEADKIIGKDNDAADTEEIELTAEDEALVKSIQFGNTKQPNSIKRLDEEDEQRLEEERQKQVDALAERQQKLEAAAAAKKQQAMPTLKVKRKRVDNSAGTAADGGTAKKASTSAAPTAGGLASLLGGYGSSSDDDDDSD